MKKVLLLTMLSYFSFFAIAQIPSGYYNSADGLTGYELKSALNLIITNGHIDQGYGALYSAYVNGDTDPEDGFVWDMYSEIPGAADPYNFTHNSNNCGTYSAEGDCYNREHLVPQSVFSEAYPMRSDYFNVIPTDGYVNGRRSNYAFGEVSSPTWTSLNGSKVGSCDASLGYTGTVFEPIDEYKGDIARSLFYFATRYETQVDAWSHPMLNGTENQVFSDWFLALLLKWHEQDPVSTKEIVRNTAGYNFQGNANPFISHPEWVNSIWGEAPVASLSFTSEPVTEATQDNVYAYNITFEGEAGGVFTLTKESTDSWLSLTDVTNNSATLTGTPLAANTGTNAVSLKLSDGTTEVFQNFSIEVSGSATPDVSNVFINEIHYDNASTDVDEAIEIAGPAGTDLTGWSIFLYNGSNSSVYNTINLSGSIPNQQNGYGTVVQVLPANGLQNGAPDGLALINASNSVVQFLSYEGVITAADGPAVGMTSTDIGVSETSSTLVGQSLQLIGTGTTYAEFVWQANVTNTYGAVNTDQFFGTPTIPVVINEFVFNHTGSDTDEFVEVLSNPNTDLSEYTLLEIEGDGAGAGTIDEVITLGTTDANGYYTTAFASNQFENGTVSLLLVKNFTGTFGDDLDTDNDGVLDSTPWDEVVDDIAVKDGTATDLTYASVTLEQSFDGSTYTVGGASRFPNGTDTDATSDWVRNDYDGEGLPSFPTAVADEGEAINTPGAENTIKEVVVEATVLINEIDADTEGTDILEFVELYDGGVGNTALDGYVLVFYNGSNDLSYATYDLDGYSTDANGYFVLGNAGVANVSIVFSSNGLQNGADAVALYKADGTEFPNGTAVTTANLEDAIVYDTNDSDDAGLLALLNTDEAQINEDGNGDKDFHSLQRYPNGEGGLRNTSTYTQAIPTPGAANTNATEPVSLIINEVDADTPGTDIAEFIELYDGGVGNTALDGYVVVLYNGNGDASYNAFDLAGYTTNAEGYFVLGNVGVPNVGLVFGSNGLQNGADAVALYSGTAADFPNGTAVTTTNLVDALVYDTNDADDTELLVLLNAGEAQINEGQLGDNAGHSNQRIPNGEGGARNTSTYTQATPTPGAANGGVTPVETITIQEARNAVDGTTVTVSGVLTVSDQFNGSAYIQDATGAIAVYDAQVHGAGLFNIGDSITITGVRSSYNDQLQISGVTSVENNGLPIQPIVPVDVTLSQLVDHPAQLVRVVNTTFPAPGQLMFGNSNYAITDVSGSGEIRIDADVTDIVGFAQPETCSEIVGVVSRYYEIYQLMPRVAADLPCAEKWQPSGNDLTISKDLTLDVAAWNIEWFGDEGNNSPADDAVQKDSAKTVLLGLDADVYAVEEITDDVLFAQMVSEMPGYSFVLSDATSYPGSTGDKQKVGFIFKTSTVSMLSTKVLLETAHPYYNGGDASLLGDFPDSDKSRFFASGRLPFMMTADVTIDGTTQRISFIALHARANSSSAPQARYDMRKYDVEALKDTLDTYYANDNIILLGDYNDDVDETVADISSTITSYEAYVNDAANYTIPTATLSANGFRSYVFRENMIDHIMVSNELTNNIIDGSARVHYEFYDSDYASTTSDHLPVSTRLMLETLTIASTSKTDISCNGNADGTATVTAQGGFEPYTYEWSDGQTTQTAVNIVAGAYDVYVTDALGTTVSAQVIVDESAPMQLTMVESQTVYVGYPYAATAELSATEISGGTPEYSYQWNTGETTESIVVEPLETTAYTLTVTDANNCSVSGDVIVNAVDIACGCGWLPKVTICYRNHTFCLPVHVAKMFVMYGAKLGTCGPRTKKSGTVAMASSVAEVEEAFIVDTKVYPNPFTNEIKLTVYSANSTDIELLIYSTKGELVHSESRTVLEGQSQLDMELGNLKPGAYIIKTNGIEETAIRIVKK